MDPPEPSDDCRKVKVTNKMSTTNSKNVAENIDDRTSPVIDNTVDSQAECGIGNCKPAALRKCATMPVFTGVYSISVLLTSTLSSYVISQVTTLERHFGFSSTQTGFIIAANDAGFLVIVLFISFVAAQVHIPRALGYVTILFGVSGIFCALPHFLFGAPSPTSLTDTGTDNVTSMTSAQASRSFTGQICDGVNHTSLNCDVTVRAESADSARANAGAALGIIVAGMVLQGMAKTPRYAFVTTYVDANVAKVKTGFYVGIVTTLAIMGPAVAFGLGSVFSRVYVTLEDTDMHYRNPKWIGAWWLGYVTFGSAACVVAIPLFCFPRRIKREKGENPPASSQSERVHALKRMSKFVKSFFVSMFRLWKNPVFMFYTLSTCALLFAVAGGQSFSPKYMENQFAFPTWKANITMAAMVLSTSCLGTFLGGYLTRRFSMGPMCSLKFIVVMNTLSATFLALLMAFKCDQPFLYNSPGPRATEETRLAECMESCACDDGDYFPVCGEDGRTFFSACHAGCQDTVDGSYVNCTCITGGTAVAGTCDYGCSMFYLYVIFLCLGSLVGTASIMPGLVVIIRAVEERDKPLALGFQSFMASVAGWMLGPICFGKWIDGVCIQWEKSCTGGGACRLYDNDDFRFKLLGYQSIFRAVGLVFIVLALISAKVTNTLEKNEAALAAKRDMQMTAMKEEKGDHSPNKEKDDKGDHAPNKEKEKGDHSPNKAISTVRL